MKATLPLLLELTQPTEMASSLEEVLKESYKIEGTKYNHETQVRETSEGVAMLYNGGSSSQCTNETKSFDYGLTIDLKLDIQVDDAVEV